MKAKAILAVLLAIAGTARADFALHDNEQITVNHHGHGLGQLWDTSHAFITDGGDMNSLYAYNSSTVTMDGGSVDELYANNTSTVEMSAGHVNFIYAYDSSVVELSSQITWGIYVAQVTCLGTNVVLNISGQGVRVGETLNVISGTANISGGAAIYNLSSSGNTTIAGAAVTGEFDVGGGKAYITGGSVKGIIASGNSLVEESGGTIAYYRGLDSSRMDFYKGYGTTIDAMGTSTVTLHSQDFTLGTGLSLNGQRLRGTGAISGKWLDGSTFYGMEIRINDDGAIEPCKSNVHTLRLPIL